MYAFPFHLADLVSCGKPPPVLNAQDWYQFTSIGTNVTYECNPGYTLFGPINAKNLQGKWEVGRSKTLLLYVLIQILFHNLLLLHIDILECIYFYCFAYCK